MNTAMPRHEPSSPAGLRRARRVLAGFTGALCVANLTLGIGILYLRSDVTPVAVDEVVRRYRANQQRPAPTAPGTGSTMDGGAPIVPFAESAPTTGPASSVSEVSTTVTGVQPPPIASPAPGVYVYATSGLERSDALGGSEHEYPSETTITRHATPCGYVERWDALDERWTETHSCHDDGAVVVERWVIFHSFFRFEDERAYSCDPGSHLRPATPEIGREWKFSCRSSDQVSHYRGRTLAIDSLSVGGQHVDALRVQFDYTLTGSAEGYGKYDVWFALGSSLRLRERWTVDTITASPIGRIRYHEECEVLLTSLEPRV